MIEDNETPLWQKTVAAKSNGTCLRESPHRFERHVGIKVFNRTGMAWIQLSMVAGADDAPEMWICVRCGEEGYEVPA